VSVIGEVQAGNLPKSSAMLIIQSAFPTISEEVIRKILEPIIQQGEQQGEQDDEDNA
jgi:hypothetical protein